MGFYDNMMGIYMANNTVCVFFFCVCEYWDSLAILIRKLII